MKNTYFLLIQVRLHILLQLDGLSEWMPAMAEQVRVWATSSRCNGTYKYYSDFASGIGNVPGCGRMKCKRRRQIVHINSVTYSLCKPKLSVM